MELKKVITAKYENMVFSVVVDSDGDAEPALLLQIKLPEVIAEAIALLTNPKAA